METIRFDELNLDPRILRAVTDMGFEAASPIQAQAIPVEMEGHDMIGQAQTGTGKTAAFGIPLLMKMDLVFLDGQPNGDQALCSYIYERWYYCKNNLYAPDRLSYSDSRQLHCANDIFPESVLGLRL